MGEVTHTTVIADFKMEAATEVVERYFIGMKIWEGTVGRLHMISHFHKISHPSSKTAQHHTRVLVLLFQSRILLFFQDAYVKVAEDITHHTQ